MDIQLFAVKLDRPLTAAEADVLLRVMPPERRERLARLPREALRHEPLCAYALLYMAVRARYGWKTLPRIVRNKYGKPEFAEHPDVRFNISHTRHAALVGLHDEPLGVDVEKLRPVSERTMQRAAGTVSQREFFERWVRSEARVKCRGAGLGTLRGGTNAAEHGERVVPLDTFAGYAACLCTRSAAPVAPVRTFVIR